MMNKWTIVLFCLLISGIGSSSAQSLQVSAVIHVIGEDIFFQRADTEAELSLGVGATALFGIGDRIRTGANGRVLISPTDEYSILLLPNSEYSIVNFLRDEHDKLAFDASLRGIAVHNFSAESRSLQYHLDGEAFDISDTKGQFAVWSVPDGLQGVTMLSGELSIHPDNREPISLTSGMGYAFPYTDTPLALTMPFHAARVVDRSEGCRGTVVTGDTAGLRLREGAALDYNVVAVLQDGQEVRIVGQTENGLWYRIPFQTGFGWTYSGLIDANCEAIPQFPNLIGEEPEHIRAVTEIELSLLEAFYGTVVDNPVFYR
jgi:uncharacterized protein YgiM (DUF1202 family)